VQSVILNRFTSIGSHSDNQQRNQFTWIYAAEGDRTVTLHAATKKYVPCKKQGVASIYLGNIFHSVDTLDFPDPTSPSLSICVRGCFRGQPNFSAQLQRILDPSQRPLVPLGDQVFFLREQDQVREVTRTSTKYGQWPAGKELRKQWGAKAQATSVIRVRFTCYLSLAALRLAYV